MGIGKAIGFGLLALLWIWLCSTLVISGGFNFKNLFLIIASGIIIFVPLWKRYIRPNQKYNKH